MRKPQFCATNDVDPVKGEPQGTAGVERGTLALAAGTSTAGSLVNWLQTVTGGRRSKP